MVSNLTPNNWCYEQYSTIFNENEISNVSKTEVSENSFEIFFNFSIMFFELNEGFVYNHLFEYNIPLPLTSSET